MARKTRKARTAKSKIMWHAWQIAQEGAVKYGGRPSLYIREALRMAWAASRKRSIVSDLERAASRTYNTDRDPATRRQIGYLASLIAAQGGDAAWIGCECTQTNAVLTKRMASRYIEDLKAA